MANIHANCALCAEPVDLEIDGIDNKGRAVHDDCRIAVLRAEIRILESTSRSLLVLRALAKPERQRAVA